MMTNFMKMFVEVSIPASNYHTDLKNPVLKMSLFGCYVEDKPEKRWRTGYTGEYITGGGKWLEKVIWHGGDLVGSQMWAVVYTNGCSWYCSDCFPFYMKSDALKKADFHDSCGGEKAWVVCVDHLE